MFIWTCVLTVGAFVWLISCVCYHVLIKILFKWTGVVTDVAGVWTFTCVCAQVSFQVVFQWIWFPAMWTNERFLPMWDLICICSRLNRENPLLQTFQVFAEAWESLPGCLSLSGNESIVDIESGQFIVVVVVVNILFLPTISIWTVKKLIQIDSLFTGQVD